MTEISRRALMGMAGTAGLAVLAGCAAPEGSSSPSSAPTRRGTPDVSPTDQPTRAGAKALLVYFSRAGENYWDGGRRDLEVGNTKVIARMIAERIECDVFEIQAADPYPHAYDPTVERNQREQNTDARPEIEGELPDLSGYDTVLLGSPVWNTRAPMIMRTFLDRTDALSGKRVLPFLTYAVGEGSVFDDYEQFCPDAQVEDGLAIRGEEARDAAGRVDAWLRSSGLV